MYDELSMAASAVSADGLPVPTSMRRGKVTAVTVDADGVTRCTLDSEAGKKYRCLSTYMWPNVNDDVLWLKQGTSGVIIGRFFAVAGKVSVGSLGPFATGAEYGFNFSTVERITGPAAWVAGSPTIITAPLTGWYNAKAWAYATPANAAGTRRLVMWKNGIGVGSAPEQDIQGSNFGVGDITMKVDVDVFLAAGDTLGPGFSHSASVSMSIASAWFSWSLIP